MIIVERAGRRAPEIRIDVTHNAYTSRPTGWWPMRAKDAPRRPEYPWDDILGNMRTLDRWREAVGVHLPMDDEAAAGRPC